MTNFNRGGEGMAVGQGDIVTKLQSDRGLSNRPISINDRLLRCTRSDEQEMERSDERGANKSSTSRLVRCKNTLCSPAVLLKSYCGLTEVLLNVRREKGESKAEVIQSVKDLEERCSVDPLLIGGRYGSDQETGDLSSFFPTDYLPYNYDVNRRVQENRKTGAKRELKKLRGEYEEDQQRLSREGVRYDF